MSKQFPGVDIDAVHKRQPKYLDDGCGNLWELCGPECGMEILRPGFVQCTKPDCPQGISLSPMKEKS